MLAMLYLLFSRRVDEVNSERVGEGPGIHQGKANCALADLDWLVKVKRG